MQQLKYSDLTTLVTALTTDITSALAESITQLGYATLVLSGGSTPIPLYQALSQQDNIDWSKVTLTFSDERWVPLDDPASNCKMVQEHLLQNYAKKAKLVPLAPTDATAYSASIEQALPHLNQVITSLPHPYTYTLIGMGNDGHTASLFPCAADIKTGLESTDAVIAMHPKTAPHQRISMTRSELLKSHKITLMIKGAEKLSTLETALTLKNSTKMPIYSILEKPASVIATTTETANETTIAWCP